MGENKKLNILWTTGEINSAINMVLMYATNCKLHNWWDEVTVLIWGESVSLVAQNEAVRKEIQIAEKTGVRFVVCVSCAVRLGVADQLESLGFETTALGQSLTELLQRDGKLLTV